jgi:DnaA family protein
MNSSNPQMALNVRLRREATFTTYYPGPNAQAVTHLLRLGQPTDRLLETQMYLWGAVSTGKSHLLQALCHEFTCLGMSSLYLPLRMFGDNDAAVLNDLGALSLVCIDDLDVIAGRPRWEMGLFNLINGLRLAGHTLVLASRQNPTHLPIKFPDLISRLVWGPVFRLKALDDDDKLAALRFHAKHRGLVLSEEVGRYLLSNLPRDLVTLLRILDRLDEVSLAAQRRLTIPFIKSVNLR